jgi:alpha-glucosidase
MRRLLCAASSFALLLALALGTAGCSSSDGPPTATSPDGNVEIAVSVDADGAPQYEVSAHGRPVIEPSGLGVELKDGPALDDNFQISSTSTRSVDETWTPVWGTDSTVTNRFSELTVQLRETEAPNRKLTVVARAYDDGVAFRYRFPKGTGDGSADSLVIMKENTFFRFAEDHDAWWIPGNPDSYERIYLETPISQISQMDSVDAGTGEGQLQFAQFAFPHATNTPITMRSPDEELWLAVHEADLTDYAGMKLKAQQDERTAFKSLLTPWPNGDKVRAAAPHESPWRTIQIAQRPGGLIESHLLQNLNEPSKIEDTSWIEPQNYIGIWWGMHLDVYSWGYEGGTHGATTERTKRYMDFAAENGIDAVLVEGWNTGWEGWGTADNFDFTESYPDFDLQEVVEYGEEKGVELMGHHETGGDIPSYEKQMDAAFALYDSLGVRSVKTGYAGKIRPEPQHHHGQWMVRHYRDVVKTAAEHGVMVNAHEPIKGTGIARTWPNMMTREGVRGMEWNASTDFEGNPPRHTVTLPFTRGLAGPIDYTPGVFDLTYPELRPNNRVRTTLSKQLANEVILYSPLQMASDMIENYEGQEAFAFIERVPADWSESHVVNAQIGDFITVARQEKGSRAWFVGSTTALEARELDVPLDFLDDGTTYVAHVYEDVPEQDYETNPHDVNIRRVLVTSEDTLTADLGRSGGQAVILEPATEEDREQVDELE